ncbi:MAG TPA: D-lyxose/D-mannose family sugar isomerase [Armatimonadetes bacterium]|nr:D-lyxose/D-mannose family sugar isomerase [Armatimonadota bacterium]
MKRSEINALMEEALRFFAKQGFHLPPFAFWTPEEWQRKGPEADEIRRNRLGWDLTDFGSGDFHRVGLLLFTLRNGNVKDPANRKPYAEKIMIVEEGQVTPWHFHQTKIEDIINRGGGELVLELANATEEGKLADTPVTVSTDGVERTVEARGKIVLQPGESITIPQRLYHTFYGREGGGKVLVGEVSSINDDQTDNYFLESVGRFPAIEEDVPPLYLLCFEYPTA